MDRFEYCLGVTLGFEGGYSNHGADRGGKTNFGVTQATYDAYRVKHGQPRQPVEKLTQAEAFDLYQSGYWSPSQCARFGAPADIVVFDTSVNSGIKRAMVLMQRALGVDDDGVFGPASWNAYDAQADKKAVARKFLGERESYYHDICIHDASQLVFIRGWLNRVDALRKIVG